VTPHETRISLGTEPVPVPEPFAGMLTHHLHNRPNLRTAGGMIATPRLFPGHRPGKHLDAQTIMMRLRSLGINLLGARNSALGNLVAEVPPPLVAELLGYSYQVKGPPSCRRQIGHHCGKEISSCIRPVRWLQGWTTAEVRTSGLRHLLLDAT
jgi:hypothetical protein